MEPFGRQPPRFVPTLTDVVPQSLPLHKPAQPQEPVMDDFLRPDGGLVRQEDAESTGPVPSPVAETGTEVEASLGSADSPNALMAEPADAVAADRATAEPVWPSPESAHVVDTSNWEAVGADAGAEPVVPELLVSDVPAAPVPDLDLQALQDLIVARILARVQPQLEAHLREVVADVVSQHTEAMAHSLHLAVEDVVQLAVTDAMEQEKIQAKLGLDAF